MFFNVALLGKKINKICIQANSKQDVVNTMVKATHDYKLWLNEHMRSKGFLKTVQRCTFSNAFRQSVPRERASVRK